MTKFLGFLATLKITLITASIAFACGEILPVILISALFSLVQLNAKPVGGILPQDSAMISPSDGRPAALTDPTE
ncbi:MAG: hypothetical protein WA820_26350 [Bradyrhizobium sp.]|jgi:hypothetical protein